LALMLRDGYDAVNVDAIAAAAGIGRTTFFRYFGSKPGVIWAPFDATIDGLEAMIDTAPSGGDPFEILREAIVGSTRTALYSSAVWLERFQLLDAYPSLRSEAYEHWERWKQVVAQHVARAAATQSNEVVPMAVAGACQGVFLAELRDWNNRDEDREDVLDRLDRDLLAVCSALRSLLP